MFSVLVPHYRHGRFLAEGVASALRSPLVSEVLLVDDGSPDGSRAVVERLARAHPGRVRELPGSGAANRGAARRLDELAAAARCDWLAVLNSDDAFTAGRFELVQRRARGGVEFVCGHLVIVDKDGRIVGTKKGVLQPEYPFPDGFDARALAARSALAPILANQNVIATTSNMVFTRALWERVGGFRDHRYVHDWDFALRAATCARCLYLPHPLAVYRLHRRNTITGGGAGIAEEVRALFDALLAEQPALREDPDFERGLRGNRYLDTAWFDAHPPPVRAESA